ncbi:MULTISPECIES: hypothetical protein [unclassified Acidovorax]|uniref:hypothetical protein n=1 Tax=unclassified Acidovorax TaxID=2684926 RepID=UPI002882DA68|nr:MULTISPECIES: hypothetical protein [unclassified Acidovorax]
MTPVGDLREFRGIVEIKKIGNRDFPVVVNNQGMAKCELVVCASKKWMAVRGVNGVAIIDDKGNIFGLTVGNRKMIEIDSISQSRHRTFIFNIFAVSFLFANIYWLFSILRKDNEHS